MHTRVHTYLAELAMNLIEGQKVETFKESLSLQGFSYFTPHRLIKQLQTNTYTTEVAKMKTVDYIGQYDSYNCEPLTKVIWGALCYLTNWSVDRSSTVYIARGPGIIDLNLPNKRHYIDHHLYEHTTHLPFT